MVRHHFCPNVWVTIPFTSLWPMFICMAHCSLQCTGVFPPLDLSMCRSFHLVPYLSSVRSVIHKKKILWEILHVYTKIERIVEMNPHVPIIQLQQ